MPVNSEVSAPTVAIATAASVNDAITAASPSAKKNGISGTSAPRENIRNDEIAAPHGEPRPSSGSIPSSSRAWVSNATCGSRMISVDIRSARSAEMPFFR